MANPLKFLSFLKKSLPVVAPIVSVFNPAAGALVAVIVNQVFVAENTFGKGTGPVKRDFVVQNILASAPMIVMVIEQSLQKDVVDDEKFVEAVGLLTDGIVGVLNSVNALTPKE